MVLAISIAFFMLAGAVGVYFLVLSPHADNVSHLVSGSYEAVRSADLSVSKNFDVNMCDTRLGDVFASFPEDSSDVLTAQSIVDEVDRIRLDITNTQPKRRPMHYTFS
ncbi:MAG: hypothetical protein IKS49_03345 [Actinomycetaceae bacterium]|nr:hypothetical protein [Actinomycetaceae bacterium]